MKKEDNIIVEVETPNGDLIVYKTDEATYQVEMNGVIRHPNCTSEDTMRALAHYLQGFAHQVNKAKQKTNKMT